jgi:parvulin-like peptidyl-prolyl isomerase
MSNVYADEIIAKYKNGNINRTQIDASLKANSLFDASPKNFETFPSETKKQILEGYALANYISDLIKADSSAKIDELALDAYVSEMKEDAKRRLYILAKIKNSISDSEIKTAYDTFAKQFAEKTEYNLSQVIIEDEKNAKEAKKSLDKGEKFEKVYEKFASEMAKSASKDGKIGKVLSGDMQAEVDEELKKTEKGKFTSPIKTDFGWQIFLVEDKKQATPPSIDEVKEGVRLELESKKMRDMIEGWKKDADIQITLPVTGPEMGSAAPNAQ